MEEFIASLAETGEEVTIKLRGDVAPIGTGPITRSKWPGLYEVATVLQAQDAPGRSVQQYRCRCVFVPADVASVLFTPELIDAPKIQVATPSIVVPR